MFHPVVSTNRPRGGENPLTTGVKQAVPYRTGRESAHTTAYEASGSSGTARQEGVAVSLVYIGEIECVPPPAAVQRSTPPQLFQKI